MCKFSLVSVHLIKCIKWSIARVWQTAGREMTVLYHLLRLFTYNEEEIDHRGRKEKESHFPISSLFVLFWLLLWWEANPPPPLGRRRYWSSKLSSFFPLPPPYLAFSISPLLLFFHFLLNIISPLEFFDLFHLLFHPSFWEVPIVEGKAESVRSKFREGVFGISGSALRILTNF